MARPPATRAAGGGIFIAMGIAIGAALGAAWGQPSAGLLVGLAIGAAGALLVWLRSRG